MLKENTITFKVPPKIKKLLAKEVATFNQTTLSKTAFFYGITTQKNYLYLNLHNHNGDTYKIGRFVFDGDLAIITFDAYNSYFEGYDTDELMFVDIECSTETIQAAMKVGLAMW